MTLPAPAKWLFIIMIIAATTSCSRKITETGKASYYANSFNGRPTASGEKFRQRKLTAAHKTLPFGTRVTVINIANGKKVKVRINDRGPFVPGRVIDLAFGAAQAIGLHAAGVAKVSLQVVR